jgi:hypothetical protein
VTTVQGAVSLSGDEGGLVVVSTLRTNDYRRHVLRWIPANVRMGAEPANVTLPRPGRRIRNQACSLCPAIEPIWVVVRPDDLGAN